MRKKIYITHCSAKKANLFKKSGRRTTPDRLYTATPTKRFIKRCIERNARWAIFSDQYGIWFPHQRHGWYEKPPDSVTEKEFKKLLNNFEQRLRSFKQIWFYYNPGRFHRLYKRLLRVTKVRTKIHCFTHLNEIL